MVTFADTIKLPGGLELPNRLAKAAMTENLADERNRATDAHVRLYGTWAAGGAGLQVTGNVLVDRRCLEAPGNIAIEPGTGREAKARLSELARAARSCGAPVFMQLSHAGRQTPKLMSDRPLAPSAVAMDMPGRALYPFAPPRAMTAEEVEDAVQRFGFAAKVARETGFDGVQVHAAHGYLISQFLSPRSNRRRDQWGGHFDNRVRFLVEVIGRIRRAAGEDFPVAVKLNSADFQKGGFSHEDCLAVVDRLNALDVCFIEISGGTYEQPQMLGVDGKSRPDDGERLRASTAAREAYFVDYAKAVKARARMPVMATGGFRTAEGMNAALQTGACDLIGLARPLCIRPDAPTQLLSGALASLPDPEKAKGIAPGRWFSTRSPVTLLRTMAGWGQQGYFMAQLWRMGDGKDPKLGMALMPALMGMQSRLKRLEKARQKASEAEQAAP
jgi:2,4-dienoyl-CoA reductase-like NADH-dependent reductase (Old Yellow Enzyme family)